MMNDMRTMVQFELKWPLHYRLKFNSAKETQQGGISKLSKTAPHFFSGSTLYISKDRYARWVLVRAPRI